MQSPTEEFQNAEAFQNSMEDAYIASSVDGAVATAAISEESHLTGSELGGEQAGVPGNLGSMVFVIALTLHACCGSKTLLRFVRSQEQS